MSTRLLHLAYPQSPRKVANWATEYLRKPDPTPDKIIPGIRDAYLRVFNPAMFNQVTVAQNIAEAKKDED